MSSTVQSGAFQITANNESAAEMVEALKPKEGDEGPTVIKDRGQDVEPEKAKASEAARELGKRGGEAAAKAREAKAREAAKEAKAARACRVLRRRPRPSLPTRLRNPRRRPRRAVLERG